jgi:hypothetical protein
MSNQQPDPSPPDFRPTPPPSWITYFILAAISIGLIFIAFSIGAPDWAGLLVNLGSGIITTIIFLIIIDRKFRVNEFATLQVKTSTFTTQVASIFSADVADTVGYAKVFSNQIQKIRPVHYVERPDLENLLEKFPNGFFMTGLGGVGKTTLAQTIAIKHSEQLIIKPKGKMIPVLIPVKNWRSGNIVEQIYKEIDKFYPVRTKVLQKWIRNKPMLLIFDGLDEHPSPDTVMMEIETLRKLATNFIIVITSRSISKNSELPKVALDGFTEQETKRQLELITGSTEFNNIVENLHQMTGGYPLANTLLANYLVKGKGSDKTKNA